MADDRKKRETVEPAFVDPPVEELRRMVSRLNAGAFFAADLKDAKPRKGSDVPSQDLPEKTFRVLRAGGDGGPG